MNLRPRGCVSKLQLEPTIQALWLKRNEGVFLEEAEWEWSDKESDAYVFDAPADMNMTGHELAEAAAKKLSEQGEKLVFAMVYEPKTDRRGVHHPAVQREQTARYEKVRAQETRRDCNSRRERHEAYLKRMGID